MKKTRLCSLFLLVTMLFTTLALPAAALEPIDLQCRNAILVDGNHGDILYEKAAHEKAYPASITKVMTALLVVEALDEGKLTPDQLITADETSQQGMVSDASTAGIKPGHTLSVTDLLYCLLLPSANEASNILAVAVDGSIKDFVEHMNRRAGELGCEGTHFMNPHGLHHNDHYTTAYDLTLMMREAMKHDLFRTIIKTPKYEIPGNDNHPKFEFFNTNGLISNLYYGGYVYDKSVGGKTGSTEEAGRCLMSVAESGDEQYIAVILGSGPIRVPGKAELQQGQFTESTKLLEYGFQNFQRVTITKGSEPVDKVAVTLSREADEVMVKPQGSVTRTLPVDLDVESIDAEIALFSDTVEAPVKEGQVLGTMKLVKDGVNYGTLDLVAVNDVERSEFLYKKAQITEFFQTSGMQVLLVVILILVVGGAFYFLVIRKKRRYHSPSRRSRGNYRGGRR